MIFPTHVFEVPVTETYGPTAVTETYGYNAFGWPEEPSAQTAEGRAEFERRRHQWTRLRRLAEAYAGLDRALHVLDNPPSTTTLAELEGALAAEWNGRWNAWNTVAASDGVDAPPAPLS